MRRRDFLGLLGAVAASSALPLPAAASGAIAHTLIGAAWRGPKADDPYFAGALRADWAARRLHIDFALALPSRPHGLLALPDGGMLVVGTRPGAWLLRCDRHGEAMRQLRLDDTEPFRLGGHAIVVGVHLLTTETDYRSGRGVIAVRDLDSFALIDRWDSHGRDPHQLLDDGRGGVFVANGGVPRTLGEQKYDLARMDSALVRLAADTGVLSGQWRLPDARLSMRHLAWSTDAGGRRRLGIALQAEHDAPAQRASAPVLAVLDGEHLTTPATGGAGRGFAGDIAAAAQGGFVLSSHKAGLAQFWSPARPEGLAPVVQLEQAYALAAWPGAGQSRGEGGEGFVVATALGLGRWHPDEPALLLPWPQPMALDNHWIVLG